MAKRREVAETNRAAVEIDVLAMVETDWRVFSAVSPFNLAASLTVDLPPKAAHSFAAWTASIGSHPGKVVARAVRVALAAILHAEAKDDQKGSVANGGTEFPMHACRLFLKHCRQNGTSAAALFTDVKAAF